MHILWNMLWKILFSRRENSMILSGNYIFTRPGQKCFEIASNFTNYIELGMRGITKYHLEAKIDDDEFKISGTLLDKKGMVKCILEENSVKAPCNKESINNGYGIKDKENNIILEIKIDNNNICHLKGIIYGDYGDMVAHDDEDHFMVTRGPVTIGKSGESIGIYIGREDVLRQPEISLDIIKDHKKDLKGLLHQWRQYLPKIVSSESPFNCYDDYGFGEPPLSDHHYVLFTIESHILFKDMIYHLVNINNKLPTNWNDFKQRIIDYDNSRHNLNKNIEADVKEILFIPISIFMGAITFGKKDRSKNTIFEYNYDPDFKTLEYNTVGRKYDIAKNINESESDKKRMEHENISKEYYEKYKDIINGIIDKEIDLKKTRTELLNEINDIISYPSPFRIDCKYVSNVERRISQ